MQIDWWTLGLQTINFLVVVWLLSRFLYQPIRQVIEQREAADRAAKEAAEDKVRAADEARKAFEAKRDQLAEEQRGEEARLHAEMEKERQAMLATAEKKASDLVAEAKLRIDRERTQALEHLDQQIAELASDLARTALSEIPTAGEALLQHVTAHLDVRPESDLTELRKDLERDGNGLSVVTAAPLPDEEQAHWRDAMAKHFNGIDVRFDHDPALLGGAELRFPHAVLSFSVADRLKRSAQELKAV